MTKKITLKDTKPGMIVEIKTKDDYFKGLIIERPEMLDQNVIVLKLKNGYNIGINKENIVSVTLIKTYEKNEEKKTPIKETKGNKKIAVISTGGTISSKVDYETGGVSAKYDAKNFLNLFPKLRDIANIKPVSLMNRMSEDFLPEDWIKIAEETKKQLQECDGVVIAQGTDTMHYTAAALSFFLRNTTKPVIITGSQRSIDRGSTDAEMNLRCAIYAAMSDYAEVGIVMHATSNDDFCYFLRGTKVRKMHTSRRDAFRPINTAPIAKIFPNGKIEEISGGRKRTNKDFDADISFEEKVAMIMVYPNMDPEIFDFYLNKGYKGLVIQATALGHVPTNNKKEIVSKIKDAINKGVTVIISTQTLYGSVHPYVYTNLRKLSFANALFAKDMLPETSYVKLGWILSKTDQPDEIKKLFLQNIAGEFEKSNYHTFLY